MNEQQGPKFQLKLDRSMAFLGALFLIFIFLIAGYSKFAGMTLAAALILFGGMAIIYKDTKLRMFGMAAIVLLAMFNLAFNGLHFGIDFSGGTKIPIILEKKVDAETMNKMIDTIKSRASVLGLSEVKVKSIGDTEINVELANTNDEQISAIEKAISQQGVFLAVIDGKTALTSEDIYTQTIRIKVPGSSPGRDWEVGFTMTNEGAKKFASTAKNKPKFPVYMFLDRPTDAIIVINRDKLTSAAEAAANAISSTGTNSQLNDYESINAAKNTLKTDSDNIELYFEETILQNKTNITQKTNATKAYISSEASLQVKDYLKQKGFIVKEIAEENITPTFNYNPIDKSISIEKWSAVGLLTSPVLGEELTKGLPPSGNSVGISGSVPTTQLSANTNKANLALEQARFIESILKGGSLPVQISLGSKTTIPATLGAEFLQISILGIAASLIAIGIFISLRYRSLKMILPIVGVSISELIILLSILGGSPFNIDLAGVAGIIAAIGVGVDAQIVITDEIRKKDGGSIESKIASAFEIIKTNIVVAIVAMMPLLFSGITELIGFATSTILGAVLGFLLSRPAYAIIVKEMLNENKEAKVA
ncbi:MAG: hypothetical protein AABX38_03535 [Candidatus Micrarchaeota archaeon]